MILLDPQRWWRGDLARVLVHLHHAGRVMVCHDDNGKGELSRNATKR